MKVAALFTSMNHSPVTNQLPEIEDNLVGLPVEYLTENPPPSAEDALLIPGGPQ